MMGNHDKHPDSFILVLTMQSFPRSHFPTVILIHYYKLYPLIPLGFVPAAGLGCMCKVHFVDVCVCVRVCVCVCVRVCVHAHAQGAKIIDSSRVWSNRNGLIQ